MVCLVVRIKKRKGCEQFCSQPFGFAGMRIRVD